MRDGQAADCTLNRGLESFSWGFSLGVAGTLVMSLIALALVLWVSVREKQEDRDTTPP